MFIPDENGRTPIKMLKIAVCDDEPYMLKDLSSRLKKYMEEKRAAYQVLFFASGKEILDSAETFDILFLDVQMEKPDGMETAKRLRECGYRGILIFITVLRESVFDAFEVQAFDYLIKPLDDSRFQRTLSRAMDFLRQETGKHIILQKNRSCEIIPFSEIVYCEVYGRKIYVHRLDGAVIDFYDKLDDLEKRMDSRFFRCHRSYLVSLDYVRGYHGGLVLLADGGKIPVSRLREQELTKAILLHMKERGR